MAESLSKASPDRLEHHREFRHHGDLVVFGFQRLRRKYHPTTAERPGSPYVEHALSALSIDKVTTQKALANQLQSSILPPLEEHITSLLLALDVSRLRNEPGPNLSLVLQIQADLNYRLDQIKYLIATLYPEPTSVPNRTDDHDLEEFKAYRLSHQKINSEGMLALCMCGILNAANELIKQMNLSSTPSVAGGDTCSLEKTFHVSVCYAFATIEVMSDCFQVSELALVQNSWRGGRTSIRATLQSTIEKLTPSFNPTNVENQSQPPPKFIGETVIQLAKLTLPILKLSKIFFDKFSERGLSQERLPIFTEMCSDQINILAQSARHVAQDLRALIRLLSYASIHPANCTNEDFTKRAELLKSRFESPLFLVLMYLIPLIPDTDGLNVENDYTSWCVTWNNLMASAFHNFTCVAESYAGTP